MLLMYYIAPPKKEANIEEMVEASIEANIQCPVLCRGVLVLTLEIFETKLPNDKFHCFQKEEKPKSNYTKKKNKT